MAESTIRSDSPTTKKIHDEQDLRLFLESSTFQCNEAVKNKSNSAVDGVTGSPAVEAMVEVLDELVRLVDETPPIQQPTRFGNKAFRDWHSTLVNRSEEMMGRCLDESNKSYAAELATYLTTSFGNEVRIDYGSGHEATFVVLLFCLSKLGVFQESDQELLVLRVFKKYLEVSRKLQSVYFLEPAGSRGVWGLDDFSFLNFLWGASQLHDNKEIPPLAVVSDERLVEQYAEEFLYLDGIRVIKIFKKGPFHEHSPMLRYIADVREGWPKINTGLLKMYRAEVWSKRPVVQHMLFGSIFQFDP